MIHPTRIRLLIWLGSALVIAGGLLVGLAALHPEAIPSLALPPLPATPTPAYAGTPLALPPSPQALQSDAPLLLPAMPVEAEALVTLVPSTAEPPPAGAPQRLVIPAIGLDVPVQPVGWSAVEVGGQTFGQWAVPDGFAAGWHTDSARPGAGENLVLNGHHNAGGQVFGRLIDLRPRDAVIVHAGGRVFQYTVSQIMVLAEEGQPPEVRLANAGWIQPGGEPRLTLVTCWPPEGNSHRLIVIAVPAE